MMNHMLRSDSMVLCGDRLAGEGATDDFEYVTCPACLAVLGIIATAIKEEREPDLVWVNSFMHHVDTCPDCLAVAGFVRSFTPGKSVQADYLCQSCRHAHALYAQLTAGMDHEVEGIISA